MGWDISLSVSKLNKFNNCPRCFWDMVKADLDYRGIMATITYGVDRVMKEYNDSCRAAGILPVELAGAVPEGTRFFGTCDVIKKYRHWKSCPLKPTLDTPSGVVSLIMGLDDVLLHPDGSHSPLDGKSKGDEPKDDGSKYYQTQIDIYSLGMKLCGMPASGFGYLWYRWPQSLTGTGECRLGSKVYRLTADQDRARDTIARAAACLMGGQPDASPACELCQFAQARVEAALKPLKEFSQLAQAK